MSRLSDTTFPNPFFLAVKMRCITSMDIKIFTIDVAGQCAGILTLTHYTTHQVIVSITLLDAAVVVPHFIIIKRTTGA